MIIVVLAVIVRAGLPTLHVSDQRKQMCRDAAPKRFGLIIHANFFCSESARLPLAIDHEAYGDVTVLFCKRFVISEMLLKISLNGRFFARKAGVAGVKGVILGVVIFKTNDKCRIIKRGIRHYIAYMRQIRGTQCCGKWPLLLTGKQTYSEQKQKNKLSHNTEYEGVMSYKLCEPRVEVR